MNSINTIRGIRISGVPLGIWWASNLRVLNFHPDIIEANQAGKANENPKIMWADAVKMNGNKPKKLFIETIINKLRIITNVYGLFFTSGLNSFNKNLGNSEKEIKVRVGLIQKITGIEIKINILNQFKAMLLLQAGSKVENKLVIIFKKKFLLF